MKTETIRVRTEPELKAQAEAIFEQMGLNTSTAVNMFFRQTVTDRGMPFRPTSKSPSIMENPEFREAVETIRGRVAAAGLSEAEIEELVESL